MNGNLEIQYLPISSLRLAEYNPRKHSKEALEELKKSLSRFGAVDPIILNGAPNRMNVVIGGHMRLKALKELGEKTVPVVYINLPDLEKEKGLNIRLNKNTGYSNAKLGREHEGPTYARLIRSRASLTSNHRLHRGQRRGSD